MASETNVAGILTTLSASMEQPASCKSVNAQNVKCGFENVLLISI
jgi:hypothetical protein